MSGAELRVGIVGAGANTRARHLPGLRSQENVRVVAVANSTLESSQKAAAELEIPQAFATWQELVERPEIDAVVIGTWPNLHRDVTCAALAAGKHVLCEARMARNVAEAREMLAAAEARPDRVAMVVPSPYGLVCDAEVRELFQFAFLGDLREVVVIDVDESYTDYSEFLHWRQDAEISGINVLSLGILHETVSRWIPQPVSVFAQTQIFEPTRPDAHSPRMLSVTVPESVQALTQYANGARGIYHFSGMTFFGPGRQIHLFGSQGTIKIVFENGTDRLFAARVGDPKLREVIIPEEKRGRWRVEEEFVRAIRGLEPVRHNDFATALRDLEFTEAVQQSATLGTRVNLPN